MYGFFLYSEWHNRNENPITKSKSPSAVPRHLSFIDSDLRRISLGVITESGILGGTPKSYKK